MREIAQFRRLIRVAGVVAVTAGFVVSEQRAGRAAAAVDVQSLVAQAERNTNTVNTLVHQDRISVTTPTLSYVVVARGTEDEVKNREQDYESVTVNRQSTGSKATSLKYSVDIIFMGGMTYYKTSSSQSTWQTRKGMTFADPFTGGWKRGRTTVSYPKSYKFQQVSSNGNETQVRATFSTSQSAGTVDLWIRKGTRPFVIRELEKYHAVKGTSGSVTMQVTFSAFNSPVNISPPTQGSA